MLVACCLPVPHGVGNCPRISSGHERQPSQNMGDWDHVHHRVRARRIEHLCSNLGSAWPPGKCLPRAVIPQSLNHSAFALLKTARISTNVDGEQQCHTPIPALVDRRAESGPSAMIKLGRRDEEDVVLTGPAITSVKQRISHITCTPIQADMNRSKHLQTDMGKIYADMEAHKQ